MDLLKRTGDDPEVVAATLADARTRIAEQRQAAERLLEQARSLESRIADEAERAKVARVHAEFKRLSAAVAAARADEQRAMLRFHEAVALVDQRRATRERLEAELLARENTLPPFTGPVPTLQAIDELSALEARLGTPATETEPAFEPDEPSDQEPLRWRLADLPLPWRLTNLPQPSFLWILAGAALILAGLIAYAVFGKAGKTALNVCSTTMTERFVSQLATAYVAGRHTPPPMAVGAANDRVCDVRIWAASNGPLNLIVAHDGLVAIVNRRSRLSGLTTDQLRSVFAGRTTDWSQLGERRGAIEAVLPDQGTNEGHILAQTLFHDMVVSSRAQRLQNSGDVVRAVANHRNAIGVVAFSAAAGARRIGLDGAPPPSAHDIAAHHYPLTADVLVDSDLRTPRTEAARLLAFAHSADAQAFAARSGLVPNRR
jgi:hypothetical protein